MSDKFNIDVNLLINLVECQPILYDKRLKEYKDTHKRDTVWTSIAQNMNLPASVVKTRWETLRQQYSKVKKIMDLNKRSDGATGRKKKVWTYYSPIDKFLNKHIEPREKTRNLKSDSGFSFTPNSSTLKQESQMWIDDGDDEELENSENFFEVDPLTLPYQAVDVISPSNSSSPLPISTTTSTQSLPNVSIIKISSKSRLPQSNLLDDTTASVETCIGELKSTIANNETTELAFGYFIAKELSEFACPTNRDKVKGKICELIFKYKNISEDRDIY